MKKVFLLMAMVAAALTAAQAQQMYQPIPFPSDKTFWCEQYDSVGVRDGMLDYFHVRNTFFLNGEDTIISGIRHKKLFFSYNGDTTNACYYGGIYEDSLRRVWYNGKKPPHIEDFFQTSDEYSCLLFDFSLDVGDTIDYMISNADAGVVSRIDTIEMGGVLRKKIHFSGMDFTWIEGIGSTFGLLYYNGATTTCDMCPSNKVRCVIQNDSLIYHWGNGNCFPTNSIEAHEGSPHITAYPNPTKDRITFDFGEARFSTLRLVNTAGATVLETTLSGHEPQHTLQLKGLPAGIYSCILSGKDGTATEKIVVE